MLKLTKDTVIKDITKKKQILNFFWENVLNLIFIIKVQKSFKKKK